MLTSTLVTLITCAVTTLALVFQIIAVATSSWITVGSTGNMGLFESCAWTSETYFCWSHDEFIEVRALAIMAVLGMTVTMLIMMAQLCGKVSNILRLSRVLITIITGVFVFIAIYMFTSDTSYDLGPYGYSLDLSVASGVFVMLVVIESCVETFTARYNGPCTNMFPSVV